MIEPPPVPPSRRPRRWALPTDDVADGPAGSVGFGPELALDSGPADAAAAILDVPLDAPLAPPRPAALDQTGLARAPAQPLRQGASLPNPNARPAVAQGAGLAASRAAAAPPPLPPPVPLNGLPAEPRQPPLLREHRVLLFHPTLLCQALHHAGRDRLRLPIEDVTSAEMLTDSQSVRFRFGPGGRSGEVVVNTPGLGATLIAYCIGTGIPIPASAAKSLHVTEHGVKLELRLTLTTPPYFRPRGSAEW